MTNDRFVSIPESWEPAGSERLDRALEVVGSVLNSARVVDDVARYYNRDSNFAGATFLDLDPADP